MPMLDFANGLSTPVLKIFEFPELTDVLKMLSRFPTSNNYSTSCFYYNTSEGGDRLKNDKNSKSVSSFFTNVRI